VHDVVRLEKRGLPTVNVGTEVFLDEGLEQARVLGMADYRMVWVPHPVAPRSTDEIQGLAREHTRAIVARLTGRG
jgi:hypothetical protein